jgi:hypothetical protein
LENPSNEIEIFYKKQAMMDWKLDIYESYQENDYILTIKHDEDIVSCLVNKGEKHEN